MTAKSKPRSHGPEAHAPRALGEKFTSFKAHAPQAGRAGHALRACVRLSDMSNRKSPAAPDRWIALLRGINVGGKTMLSMAQLRALIEELGYCDVETYIQSGNVIFRAEGRANESAIARNIRAAVERQFDRPIGVVVRRQSDLAAALKANPFPKGDPSRVVIAFCDARPTGRIDPERSPGDEATVRGREVYVNCPNGVARSKFTLDYLERVLGVVATARNVRTVATLAAWGLERPNGVTKGQ